MALAAIATGVVAQTLAVRVPAEISLNYGEGFVQLDVQRTAAGGALYGDPAQQPWTLQVYTPLYPWLVARLAPQGGSSYVPGRLVGYAAVLGTALLVGLAGRRRTGASAWGVAAFYLTLPLFVSWGAAVRPDNLAVLCATAGVIWVDRAGAARAVLWAVPLFLAAGLAKQSTVAAPLAALVWLALRDWRLALTFGLALGAAAGLCIAALQLGSGGWFWLHTFDSHVAKPFVWARTWHVAASFFAFHAPVVVFGAGLWVWVLARRRLSCATLWLPISALAALSAGKVGSDTNYFLEPMAALALVAARELPLPLATDASRRQSVTAALAAALAVIAAAANLRLHLVNGAWIRPAEQRFAAVAAEWSPAAGDVLADDAGFLVYTGRPLVFRPFIMTQLAEAGMWDPRPLLDALENGRVTLAVIQREPAGIFHSRYTPAMRRALEARYERVASYRTDFEYELYAPKKAAR